jgi:hypothetical protein
MTNQPEQPKKKKSVSDETIYETILAMCYEAGPDGNIKPEAIARELYPEEWQSLLKRVRIFAKKLAQRGDIIILRKGKPADPDDFRGIYKLRISADYTPDSAEEEISTP